MFDLLSLKYKADLHDHVEDKVTNPYMDKPITKSTFSLGLLDEELTCRKRTSRPPISCQDCR